jgi:hypothetical protein
MSGTVLCKIYLSHPPYGAGGDGESSAFAHPFREFARATVFFCLMNLFVCSLQDILTFDHEYAVYK